MKEILIIIPAYNEQEQIGTLLEKLSVPEIREIADILVMNDASTDHTREVIREHNVPFVTHVYNLGYGGGLQVGYKYAVRRKYKYVIQMDADGQHDVCNILTLYRALTTPDEFGRLPDIVLGSRFMEGSVTFPIKGAKKFAIHYFRMLLHLFTGKKILDPTTGLQGLNWRTFLLYSQFNQFDDRYPDTNVIIRMLLLGYQIKEIPSVMHERTSGKSMHSGIKPVIYMFRMTLSVFATWIRARVLKIDRGSTDMVPWMRGFFHGKETWTFQAAKLRETAEELYNPRRGWYRIYPLILGRPLEEQRAAWFFEESEQLAFLRVNIGAYRARALDETALNDLRNALITLRSRGKELIVRAVYDTEGAGAAHEPALFERVCEHLEQLCRVVSEFAPSVFVYQGVLLGSWGEMHSSRFLTKPRLRRLIAIAERELPQSVFLAVRRPVFYRMIRAEDLFQRGEHRIGLFDDAILASPTHMGTFGWLSAAQAGWENPWLPHEEQAFEHKLCMTVPQGGEALLPEAGSISLAQAAAKLRGLHISYLNSGHDRRLMDDWRGQIWRSNDVWNGINGFDYIGRHLGYRFRVKTVTTRINPKQHQFTVRLEIENCGFAPCYQMLEAALYQRFPTGEERKLALDVDLQRLAGGESCTAECVMDLMPGSLYLCLRRVTDGRVIRLGNESEGDYLYLGKIQSNG